MYIVNDNVDLKEFEKFGFVKYSKFGGFFYCKEFYKEFDNNSKVFTARVYIDHRKISFYGKVYSLGVWVDCYKYFLNDINIYVDLFLDLVKAGLIKKV